LLLLDKGQKQESSGTPAASAAARAAGVAQVLQLL
jgi:hypothetical protein